MAWTVEFYETKRGEKPVLEFLDALPEKARAKCVSYLKLLEERGNALSRQYAGKVRDDLWELRPEFGGVEYRLFYFTFIANRIVIVHAISKKTQRLNPRDIELALSRVKEMRDREEQQQDENP